MGLDLDEILVINLYVIQKHGVSHQMSKKLTPTQRDFVTEAFIENEMEKVTSVLRSHSVSTVGPCSDTEIAKKVSKLKRNCVRISYHNPLRVLWKP